MITGVTKNKKQTEKKKKKNEKVDYLKYSLTNVTPFAWDNVLIPSTFPPSY